MKTILRLSMIFGAFIVLFASCESIQTPEPVVTSASFSEDILPIFEGKCASCHNGSIAPDLTKANAYSSLMDGGYIDTLNAESSVLYKAIAQGGAMYSHANDVDRAKILKWIQDGAQDN